MSKKIVLPPEKWIEIINKYFVPALVQQQYEANEGLNSESCHSAKWQLSEEKTA
ncbi:hypothetical protein [Brevibacillus migulae]|uniref:hypothetical protein n=1 Tax=Brevibacillus migulae TaxID=1644114 RepID=UPI0014304E3C|nr:hypothetical protein [Brevibacillus migulae]